MLTIYGRTNSANVQEVLCLAELDVPDERVDAGLTFGGEQRAVVPRADPVGASAYRLLDVAGIQRPELAAGRAWRDRPAEQPRFRRHAILALSREL